MPAYHSIQWFALCASLLTLQLACDTNAVGVDECRSIEYARCEAAPHCPDQFAVSSVEECKLFYRDQCLHGLATSAPAAAEVRACVSSIQTLSECARKGTSSAVVADCGVAVTQAKPATVCKLLAEPQVIVSCAFLAGSSTSTGGQAGSSAVSTTSVTTEGGATGASGAGGTSSGGSSPGLLDLLGLGGISL